MIKTEYGVFDGDKWEDICESCFYKKYNNEVYLKIKATPGDNGIEGFTRTGRAFQCYCPKEHYNTDKLYENHRDKISKDLTKLKTYQSKLKKQLGNTLIKEWYFVTPIYSKNEIIAHCTRKRDEVRSWNLSIIDNQNFEIIFVDINFLVPEIAQIQKYSNQKLNITVDDSASDNQKLQWKNQQISLVENAQRKHGARFQHTTTNLDKRIDQLTDLTIRRYLDGSIILDKWENNHVEDYESFIRVRNLIEEEVSAACLFPIDNNNAKYEEFKNLVNTKLKLSFSSLEEEMLINLCNYVIADWILRCPINFE